MSYDVFVAWCRNRDAVQAYRRRPSYLSVSSRNADIVAGFLAGEPLKDIAARHGVTQPTVSRLARLAGLPRRARGCQRKPASYYAPTYPGVVAQWSAGVSSGDISRAFDITRQRVSQIAHGAGLAHRSRTPAHNCRRLRCDDILTRLDLFPNEPHRETAATLGVKEARVYHVRRFHQRPSRRGHRCTPTCALIIALYVDKQMSTKKIADHLGRRQSGVYQFVKGHGVPMRSMSDATRLGKAAAKARRLATA